MSGRETPVRRTSTEAREEFIERATELWDSFNAWYMSHPEATFDEIESQLGQQRREVLGDFVELSLRRGDLGTTAEASMCSRCGESMDFKGYSRKVVHGMEVDASLPRAYYYCPTCKVGLFPPGPMSAAEEGEEQGCQDGLKLKRHSYRATLGDKATFTPALKAELARRRVKQADKISTVNDGAEWIWDLTQKYLPERQAEILDWSHGVENLAKIADAAWGEGTPEAQA